MLEIFTNSTVWFVTWSLVVVGLIGTLVPFLPGHLFIFLAALVPWFAKEDHGGLQWWSLAILGFGLVLAQALEFLSGAVGSRWFGGSRWGAFGAFTGGIVGLFFFPFGLILGPLIGAVLCEWLFAKKAAKPATVSGVGSVIGTLGGLALKVLLAALMAAYLVADVYYF